MKQTLFNSGFFPHYIADKVFIAPKCGINHGIGLRKIAALFLLCSIPAFAQFPVPSTPTLFHPTDGGTDVLDDYLAWKASSGAAWYHVQLSTVKDFATTIIDSTLTTTSIMGIIGPPGTTFFWRVSAKNASGESPWSPVWTFTTRFSYLALVSPLNNQSGVSLSPMLRWNKKESAASYLVQVATDSTFTSASNIVNDSSVTDTTRTIGPLSVDKIYYWRVRAKNAAGMSGSWSLTWAFVCGQNNSVLSPGFSVKFAHMTVSESWIRYELPITSRVSIRIFNIQGKAVTHFVNSVQNAGHYDLHLGREDLIPGNYILDFSAGPFSARKKLCVIE